jgi:hypothetical protein
LALVMVVDRGGLRRRVGSVRHMVPGSVLVRPYAATMERHADGECHYGLLFRTPWRGKNSRIAWYSTLDTRLCDRGPIRRWQCNPRSLEGDTLDVVVYLPRSWLILHGYLPLGIALAPGSARSLRDQPSLLRSFWLEEYELPGAPREATLRGK